MTEQRVFRVYTYSMARYLRENGLEPFNQFKRFEDDRIHGRSSGRTL